MVSKPYFVSLPTLMATCLGITSPRWRRKRQFVGPVWGQTWVPGSITEYLIYRKEWLKKWRSRLQLTWNPTFSKSGIWSSAQQPLSPTMCCGSKTVSPPWEMDHHTRDYVPYFYGQSMGSSASHRICRCKGGETGPTVYRPYSRGLESITVTVCRCLHKGSIFCSFI